MEQSFDHPQVYLVLVLSKSQGRIKRIDSVHDTFEKAKARADSMFVNHDELPATLAKELK